MLAEVIGKLRNPADVLAVALVGKRLNQTVRGAFLHLRIENSHLGPAHSFLQSPAPLFSGESPFHPPMERFAELCSLSLDVHLHCPDVLVLIFVTVAKTK